MDKFIIHQSRKVVAGLHAAEVARFIQESEPCRFHREFQLIKLDEKVQKRAMECAIIGAMPCEFE